MKNAKKAFVASLLAVVLCVTMLTGTTFAWFTDSVTSAGNIIKSGTLDVEMSWADGTKDPAASATTWKDASTGAIFDYSLWEPGYTQVRHIAVENVGTLALKYQIRVLQNGAASDLADVIDVYVIDPAEKVTDRAALSSLTPVGTVATAFTNSIATGHLLPTDDAAIFTIALKMRESAGNEYQGKSLGADFSVQLLATQYTYEEDSFDDQYDAQADETPDNAGWTNEVSTATATVAAGEATTLVAAAAPAAEMANTTVTIPADELTDGAVTRLEVTTTDTENASQTAYSVMSGETAAGAIDLSLFVGTTEVTTFTGPVVVETKIAAGLTGVTISYNGDATKTFGADAAGTEVTSKEAVDTVGDYYYNPADGTLVFATDHFSEYVIGTTSVAYSTTTDTAYATVQAAVDATVAGGTVIMLNDADAKTRTSIEGKTLTLDGRGHSLSASEENKQDGRTLNVWADDSTNSKYNVTLKNLTIVGPTSGSYTRGLNIGDTGTIVVDNCRISSSNYAINAIKDSVIDLKITDSTVTGWAALNIWSGGVKVNASDSTFVGTNNKAAGSSNGFATICLEGDTTQVEDVAASNMNMNFTNCTITAVSPSGNWQALVAYNNSAGEGSKNNTVTFSNCVLNPCTVLQGTATDEETGEQTTIDLYLI